MQAYTFAFGLGGAGVALYLLLVKPGWITALVQLSVLRLLPLPLWLTTPQGRIICRSSRAVALFGDVMKSTELVPLVAAEDRSIITYLCQPFCSGIERHCTLTLASGDKLRIYQTTFGRRVLWIFHKKSRLLPFLHPRQHANLLSKHTKTIIEKAPIGCVIVDGTWRVLDYNTTFHQWFYPSDAPNHNKVTAKPPLLDTFVAQGDHKNLHTFLDTLATKQPSTLSGAAITLTLSNEDATLVRLGGTIMTSPKDDAALYILYFHDVSWQKTIELTFNQTQKMQALGQLSGSIAHDFNNILTGVIGFADVLLSRHLPGDTSYSELMQIKHNAYRGANLVRQLMAFSRQKPLKVTTIDPAVIISDMIPLLERLVDQNISINFYIGGNLGYIRGEVSYLEQVIINLVVNAGDAIQEKSGSISIALDTTTVEKDIPVAKGDPQLEPGPYLRITITDTGVGIHADQLEKIFDPFYTSKGGSNQQSPTSLGSPVVGTGLGLATVYTIIQNARGGISVASKPGKGTTFTILWPQHASSLDEGEAIIHDAPREVMEKGSLSAPEDAIPHDDPQGAHHQRGIKRILVVEDDESVRLFTHKALERKGYIVDSFTHPQGALDHLKIITAEAEKTADSSKHPHLVISDVIMPGMQGPEMAKAMLGLCPSLKILFISGFTDNAFENVAALNIGDPRHIDFLSKPYDLAKLHSKVADLMAGD